MRAYPITVIISIILGLTSNEAKGQHLRTVAGMTDDKAIVEAINEYGKFDNWCAREIKESSLIGGETAQRLTLKM